MSCKILRRYSFSQLFPCLCLALTLPLLFCSALCFTNLLKVGKWPLFSAPNCSDPQCTRFQDHLHLSPPTLQPPSLPQSLSHHSSPALLPLSPSPLFGGPIKQDFPSPLYGG